MQFDTAPAHPSRIRNLKIGGKRPSLSTLRYRKEYKTPQFASSSIVKPLLTLEIKKNISEKPLSICKTKRHPTSSNLVSRKIAEILTRERCMSVMAATLFVSQYDT